MNKIVHCNKCSGNRWRIIDKNKRECRKCNNIRYEESNKQE